MKKILITGGNGYVAKSVYLALKDEYDVTSISRSDFDLCDREKTNEFFKDKCFDVIIHTAIKGGSRLQSDSLDVTHLNLSMFYNLLANRDHYIKLINIGSGAEIGYPTTPYGLSKSIISKLIDNECYFYNIRVFGLFDENELDTRFVKSNIERYINHQPLHIHQNKYMDFFYMEDLVSLINFYILNNNLLKEIDCTYSNSKTLYHITNIINHLDDYKVEIKLNESILGKEYTGKFNDLGIKYIGLEKGIENVYNKLKNDKTNYILYPNS